MFEATGRSNGAAPGIAIGGSATPEEAAAIAAAIERFTADTTPVTGPETEPTRWQRAALIEGVSAKIPAIPPDPSSGYPLQG